MKVILYLAAVPSILLAASIVEAQTSTPPNLGNSANQINNVRSIQQPVRVLNPNSGSRQFFDRGRDKLYFLEESEPILQIESENEESAQEDRIQKLQETPEQPE